MTYEVAKEFAEWYRKFLRQIKRAGQNIDAAPPEVQEAALAMHQNALLVFRYERKRRKSEEEETKMKRYTAG